MIFDTDCTGYPAGIEGLKGASLPPPGFYARDDNYVHTADKVNGLPFDVDLTAYVQAPRLMWMTDWTILGANYGMDILVPFAYKSISATPLGSDSQFNLADIYVAPLLLSWHLQQFDFAASYGVWMPTGKFAASTPAENLTSPGNSFWTHMFTLGGVWYLDADETVLTGEIFAARRENFSPCAFFHALKNFSPGAQQKS